MFGHEGRDPLRRPIGPLVTPGGHLPSDVDVIAEEGVMEWWRVDGGRLGFGHQGTVPRPPVMVRSAPQQTVAPGGGRSAGVDGATNQSQSSLHESLAHGGMGVDGAGQVFHGGCRLYGQRRLTG